MANLIRSIFIFIVGGLAGATGLFFFGPVYTIVVTRTVPPAKDAGVAPAVVVVAAPVAPSPAPVAVPPKATVVSAQESRLPLSFEAIAGRMSLWPPAVLVATITTVDIKDDEGKKVRELALEVGAILQVSKVLATGGLEVRAKGTKFEIAQDRTNFESLLRERIVELTVKSPEFIPPYKGIVVGGSAVVVAAPLPVPVVPAVIPPAPTTVVTVAIARGPLTLEDKVNIFFGRAGPPLVKSVVVPAPQAPAPVPVTPAPPAAAAPPSVFGEKMKAEELPAPVSPVVAPDNKKAEKAADLDRKINNLFKQ